MTESGLSTEFDIDLLNNRVAVKHYCILLFGVCLVDSNNGK